MLAVGGTLDRIAGRARTRSRRSSTWNCTQHNPFKAVYGPTAAAST